MKSIHNLTIAALLSVAGVANAAPNMTNNPGSGYMASQNNTGMSNGLSNPGYGYMGFQNSNVGNTGMSDISANIFPSFGDTMAGVPLNGYVVANVPSLGGMFIYTADRGWMPWDLQNLTPAVTMTNCSLATPCTQAQVAIFQGMNVNDPAVQAVLSGATIYLGYARSGQAISMDNVRQFTASDMINPGTPIPMDPALCASNVQKPRFCL